MGGRNHLALGRVGFARRLILKPEGGDDQRIANLDVQLAAHDEPGRIVKNCRGVVDVGLHRLGHANRPGAMHVDGISGRLSQPGPEKQHENNGNCFHCRLQLRLSHGQEPIEPVVTKLANWHCALGVVIGSLAGDCSRNPCLEGTVGKHTPSGVHDGGNSVSVGLNKDTSTISNVPVRSFAALISSSVVSFGTTSSTVMYWMSAFRPIGTVGPFLTLKIMFCGSAGSRIHLAIPMNVSKAISPGRTPWLARVAKNASR